jgi:hypothetical protein
VFVEVGVSVHEHTGEKQIREEGNLPDFSPTLLKNVRVNFPKIVVDGVGVGRGVDEKTFPFMLKFLITFT